VQVADVDDATGGPRRADGHLDGGDAWQAAKDVVDGNAQVIEAPGLPGSVRRDDPVGVRR
jgi:hypothetical protein